MERGAALLMPAKPAQAPAEKPKDQHANRAVTRTTKSAPARGVPRNRLLGGKWCELGLLRARLSLLNLGHRLQACSTMQP